MGKVKQNISVTANQVHVSQKNPKVSVVSITDSKSVNGFSSFPVFSNEVFDSKYGKTVSVDVERDYDISRKTEAGTYEHDKVKGQDIVNMFEAAKTAAINNKYETASVEKPVFMNRVSEKLIHATSRQGLNRVSIPDAESVNGMANILVPNARIFKSTRKGGVPIPGMMNINLGSENDIIKYSILNDEGKFVKSDKTAAEVADIWAKSQEQYLKNSIETKDQSVSVEEVKGNKISSGDYEDDEVF